MSEMPNAWVKFLLMADDYFAIYGSIENAVATYRQGLSPVEISEISRFLLRVTAMSEAECRAATTHPSAIVDGNMFKPTNCVRFYKTIQSFFEGK
jgi:hypothetical protein